MRTKRDEFSCPCCGVATDSSYCAPCVDAGCGEQDVGAPDVCLASNATLTVSRLMSAANALIGVSGARVSIGVSTEVEAHVLAKALGGETWGHATIYAQWSTGSARRWLFGFRAKWNGVAVEGQGDRPATEAECANASVWDPPETTPEIRAKALEATR